VRIAVDKAREHGHDLAGAVLASDAFFPFPDGPQLALEAGVTAIVQPGGSRPIWRATTARSSLMRSGYAHETGRLRCSGGISCARRVRLRHLEPNSPRARDHSQRQCGSQSLSPDAFAPARRATS
jgi:hypothetical protein